MIELNTEELRKFQISILDKVHAFCLSNDIKYFLAAGSLLGAIRHKGYIPWDDDIDLYLLREDYNKLISVFNTNPPENLKLHSVETNQYYTSSYAKIEDTTTLVIEEANTTKMGVNIDIFPLDDIPEDVIEKKKLYRKLCLLELESTVKTVTFTKERSIFKNLGLFFLKMLFFWKSHRKIAVQRSELIKVNRNTSTMVGDLSTFAYKIAFPRNIFDNTTDVLFEGKYYKAMEKWDEFLTCKFGDYMQLPPVEKRITHHGFKAYRK